MKSEMLSLLFVVVSLASCVSVEVDETIKIGNLYYKLNANEQVASVVPYPDYMNISSDMSIAVIPDCITYMNKSYTVTKIENYAFQYCGKLNSVFIPNSVTEIGDYAFYGCNRLDSVVISTSVKSIGQGAFMSCRSLAKIAIPNNVTYIGAEAFSGCSNLREITIPNTIKHIESWTFGYCHNLRYVSLPSNLTSIGYWAFRECTGLEVVTCMAATPPDMPDMDKEAQCFEGVDCSDIKLYVPYESVASYKAANGWNCFNVLPMSAK